MIDEEVRSIVDSQHARAKMILEENREKMDLIVQALLKEETIDREAFLKIMGIDPDNDPKMRKEDPKEELPQATTEPVAPPMPSQPPRLEPGPA